MSSDGQMGLRASSRIYIYGHKDLNYGYWADGLYQPIQVGDAKEDFLPTRDNTGTNISHLNGIFAENTGAYWVIANGAADDVGIVGQCQYRRRLRTSAYDIERRLEDNDVIMATPLHLLRSVHDQYAACHSKQDIQIISEIIHRDYPDYIEDFDKYIMHDNVLYYSCGCIMRKEDFYRYYYFYFDVMYKFLQTFLSPTLHYDETISVPTLPDFSNFLDPTLVYSKIDDQIKRRERGGAKSNKYQYQLGGFLGERLMTLWVRHNYKNNIFEIPYTKYEGV